MIKNIIVALTLFTAIKTTHAQLYKLSNEEVIFSFETSNGKKVAVCKDDSGKYLIYRFGTASKIEFEYPSKSRESLSKFKYSFYMRGGGEENAGMDLNYLAFTNGGFKYVVYHTYYAEGNQQSVGIKVIEIKTKKITDIKGNPRSQQGSLTRFRDNGLVAVDEELYD